MTQRRGVYPGSFNPPTIAHIGLADAARRQHDLDVVVLMLSRRALAKEHVEHPRFEDRLAVIEASIVDHDWLRVEVTDRQLLAEIAVGFDLVIMGADKWHQINELAWYDSVDHRARSLAALPDLAIAPRPPIPVPEQHRLHVDEAFAEVSSTRARDGALDLMTDEARTFARETGAWIDPDRYDLGS